MNQDPRKQVPFFDKSSPYYEFEKLIYKWKCYRKDNEELLEITPGEYTNFIHGVKMRILMCKKIILDLEQTIQKAKNNND